MRDLWNKTLAYFGFGEEESYDDYDDLEDDLPYVRESSSTVRRITRTPDLTRAERAASLRSIGASTTRSPGPSGGNQVRVHIIEPKGFNDAQLIADKFRRSNPVVMNLQNTDVDVARRLVDFSSGLAYGLNGAMQKIADKVFLMTPSNVDVSAEEKRRLRERGFFLNEL